MSDPSHLDGPLIPPDSTPSGAINQRIVKWENGVPVVKTQAVFSKAQVSEIAMAAASQPYVDANDELAVSLGLPPSEFFGMSNLEVMILKATRWAAESGEIDQVEKILDRLIGRPKTSAENVNVSVSYEAFLKNVADSIVIEGEVEP